MTPRTRFRWSRVARRGSSAGVGLGVVLLAAAALADTSSARAEARALADEGANAFSQGDYARAHDRLQRAFSLVPAPTIALLDARALARLGRLVEARAAYRSAFVTPTDDASPPAFREALVQARAELRSLEQRLPHLTVRVRNPPPDARVQVWLDGDELAPSALSRPFAVDPRSYTVRLDLDGKPVASRRVALREGESRAVDLDAPSSGGLSRALTIAGFGLGGAGLVTGIVAGSVALGARRDAVKGCPALRCEAGSSGASALRDFRTYRTVSTVGYAVGAAGTALGTVLLIAPSNESRTEVGVFPTWRGVDVRGAF